MGHALQDLTDATFDEVIGAADRPVLVDVWAAWCPPCRALEPVLAELADDLRGRLDVYGLDGDAAPGVVTRFGIMSFPTLLVFRDGELVSRMVGARGRNHLLQELDPVLGPDPAPAPGR